MNTQSLTVRQLLEDAGHAPWFGYQGWGDLVELADAIASTIASPVARATFVAAAATDLEKTSPSEVEGDISWLMEAAHTARPTPLGSTELWGSALQSVLL